MPQDPSFCVGLTEEPTSKSARANQDKPHEDVHRATPMHMTPTQVANHLACHRLTQFERQRREGQLEIDFSPDPRLDAMRERGLQHEQAYVEALRADETDSSAPIVIFLE